MSSNQMKQVSDILHGVNLPSETKIAKKELTSTVCKPPKQVEEGNVTEKSKENQGLSATVEISKGFTVNINLNLNK